LPRKTVSSLYFYFASDALELVVASNNFKQSSRFILAKSKISRTVQMRGFKENIFWIASSVASLLPRNDIEGGGRLQ
jgi:hypothetical protein